MKACLKCDQIFNTYRRNRSKKYCTDKCRNKAENFRHRNSPHRQILRQALKDFIYEDKMSHGCSRCPEKRPSCLEYHHVDCSLKKDCVSTMVRRNGFDAVLKEISKCILLCANCHRVETNGTGYLENFKSTFDVRLVDKTSPSEPDEFLSELMSYNTQNKEFVSK